MSDDLVALLTIVLLVKPTQISKPLNEKGIKRIQGIVGDLIYVGRAVNNKLLVALSAIGSQQAAATDETAEAIEQLLDYVATYPNDGQPTDTSKPLNEKGNKRGLT